MSADGDGFEIYQDRRGEFRWRRSAGNGRLVGAPSEGYRSKADCEANMRRGVVATDRWDPCEDRRGEWRWRRFAQNGRQVGKSSEGYRARRDAEAHAGRFGWTG